MKYNLPKIGFKLIQGTIFFSLLNIFVITKINKKINIFYTKSTEVILNLVFISESKLL